jgi:hypothetical protein
LLQWEFYILVVAPVLYLDIESARTLHTVLLLDNDTLNDDNATVGLSLYLVGYIEIVDDRT